MTQLAARRALQHMLNLGWQLRLWWLCWIQSKMHVKMRGKGCGTQSKSVALVEQGGCVAHIPSLRVMGSPCCRQPLRSSLGAKWWAKGSPCCARGSAWRAVQSTGLAGCISPPGSSPACRSGRKEPAQAPKCLWLCLDHTYNVFLHMDLRK